MPDPLLPEPGEIRVCEDALTRRALCARRPDRHACGDDGAGTPPRPPCADSRRHATADRRRPSRATCSGSTIPARPERIVSASATHTEILYAIGAGDRVVATDLFSNYPPRGRATEKIDAFNLNVEAVAALDPDLVILSFDPGDAVAGLADLGIPAILFPTAPATLRRLRRDHCARPGGREPSRPRPTWWRGWSRDRRPGGPAARRDGDRPTYYHELGQDLYSDHLDHVHRVHLHPGRYARTSPTRPTTMGSAIRNCPPSSSSRPIPTSCSWPTRCAVASRPPRWRSARVGDPQCGAARAG